MQVARWGNSLAVRIPTALAAQLRLSVGNEVALHAKPRDPTQATVSGGLAERQAPYLAEAQKSTVGQWGNSLGIRLTKALTEQLGIKEEDDVTLVQTGAGTIEIERTRTRATDRWLTKLAGEPQFEQTFRTKPARISGAERGVAFETVRRSRHGE